MEMDEFKPVSDDQSLPPEPSETVFVEGENTEAVAEPPAEVPADAVDQYEPVEPAPAESEPPAVVETPSEVVSAKPSLWVQLRQLIREDPVVTLKRIHEMDVAIERTPNGATNYVLRGELYLRIHEYELASADFEQGLALAETEYESTRWGLVGQVMRDRALNGQKKAARKLKRKVGSY